jgi:hypothetical protein
LIEESQTDHNVEDLLSELSDLKREIVEQCDNKNFGDFAKNIVERNIFTKFIVN